MFFIFLKNKWTALHWAADRGHTTVVELLLENGADSNLLSEVCLVVSSEKNAISNHSNCVC